MTFLEIDLSGGRNYRFGMAITLKDAMARAGISGAQLSRMAGCSPPEISRIASGERNMTATWARRLAPHLGIDPADLLFEGGGNVGPAQEGVTRPPPQFFGVRDLPVFAAVEGGTGDLEVSTDPVDLVPRPWYLGEVKDGFAVIVTGESMVPAYDPGDMAIVNPRLPFMRGKIHIFTAESENSHYRATIKRLVGVAAKSWKVEQFNPQKTFELSREEWTHARRVVGKFND